MVHCGTNKLDHNKPKALVDAIIIIEEVNIILTGLLPRELSKSNQRNKILKVNSYLKISCKDHTNIYYLQQIITGFIKTNHSTHRYSTKIIYI